MYTSDELYTLLEEGLKLVIVGEAFADYEETNEIFQDKLKNMVFDILVGSHQCKFIANDSVEYYIFANYEHEISGLLTRLTLWSTEIKNIVIFDMHKYRLVDAIMHRVKKRIYNAEVDDIELFIYTGFDRMLINTLR